MPCTDIIPMRARHPHDAAGCFGLLEMEGNLMGKLLIVLFLALGAVATPFDYGHCSGDELRCGSRLVSTGMRTGEVLAVCGEPTSTRSWQEGYETGNIGQRKETSRAVITVNYEEWTYNFGHSRFMQFLLFKNGVLDSIKSGGYGY
jgi:hypothetical protein